MNIVVFVFLCVMWVSVSLLCISYFNDAVDGWDEWESCPPWFRVFIVIFSPIGFIRWWFR
ncbi:hypothetical protein DET64_1182 [Marinobacter nauticus]|uniref:Transmembrane protein n=1 Tax=Marinobacter nauticus TaxID=2743 RepID=A0A368USY6_MARNT|nr:hypothetical protein DET64_1182 [Marinobacter nauticus]RCW29971.1 hypothetical protein DET51_1182 [Marinobacter nauticus]